MQKPVKYIKFHSFLLALNINRDKWRPRLQPEQNSKSNWKFLLALALENQSYPLTQMLTTRSSKIRKWPSILCDFVYEIVIYVLIAHKRPTFATRIMSICYHLEDRDLNKNRSLELRVLLKTYHKRMSALVNEEVFFLVMVKLTKHTIYICTGLCGDNLLTTPGWRTFGVIVSQRWCSMSRKIVWIQTFETELISVKTPDYTIWGKKTAAAFFILMSGWDGRCHAVFYYFLFSPSIAGINNVRGAHPHLEPW